ncbi:MAG: M20/M25/M40 family metallo-hydrolase, partial [Candidatus Hodarchaeota archaeon]
SLQYIGGGDTSILSARELVILTDKKNINAVVNRKHAHLVVKEEDIQIEKMKDAIIDIGVRKRKKVLASVKIGDPVVYKPSFNHLTESYFSGYGFDDKSGCYVLLEVIKEIVSSKRKPIPTLIFTFSVQEEIGGTKCKPLVRKYKPDLFVEVDVTFATDCGTDGHIEKEVGLCELNKGLVLYRGVDINKDYLRLIQSAARNNKIKIQYQAASGTLGYTTSYVSDEEEGIRTLILGIPLRNMHTPVEIINLNDLNNGIQLLTKFLLHKKILSPLEK